jgi:PadR family transcriptional regulator, regulatory protein PadR
MASVRITSQSLKILILLAAKPNVERYGLELAKEARVQHGTTYPILKRFLDAGWLESRPEDVDPSDVGRPRQRLYCLTALGVREAHRVLDEHYIAIPADESTASGQQSPPDTRRGRGSDWAPTPNRQPV